MFHVSQATDVGHERVAVAHACLTHLFSCHWVVHVDAGTLIGQRQVSNARLAHIETSAMVLVIECGHTGSLALTR